MKDREKIDLNLLEELTECWHTNLNDSNISLQDYLGLTDKEFQLFVTNPNKLKDMYYDD